ncbi:hypothetical protein DFJ73DRAFT_919339 [Zopfochytrium polystomum]|nr:hypothetical protein DFJ73DRAFT_919339 [Zopfochytrium polystomum]
MCSREATVPVAAVGTTAIRPPRDAVPLTSLSTRPKCLQGNWLENQLRHEDEVADFIFKRDLVPTATAPDGSTTVVAPAGTPYFDHHKPEESGLTWTRLYAHLAALHQPPPPPSSRPPLHSATVLKPGGTHATACDPPTQDQRQPPHHFPQKPPIPPLPPLPHHQALLLPFLPRNHNHYHSAAAHRGTHAVHHPSIKTTTTAASYPQPQPHRCATVDPPPPASCPAGNVLRDGDTVTVQAVGAAAARTSAAAWEGATSVCAGVGGAPGLQLTYDGWTRSGGHLRVVAGPAAASAAASAAGGASTTEGMRSRASFRVVKVGSATGVAAGRRHWGCGGGDAGDDVVRCGDRFRLVTTCAGVQMALRLPSVSLNNLPGGGDVNQAPVLTEALTEPETVLTVYPAHVRAPPLPPAAEAVVRGAAYRIECARTGRQLAVQRRRSVLTLFGLGLVEGSGGGVSRTVNGGGAVGGGFCAVLVRERAKAGRVVDTADCGEDGSIWEFR